MSRYYTAFGELSKKEPARQRRARKGPSVGQEAAQALEFDKAQKERAIRTLSERLRELPGISQIQANQLVDQIKSSDLPITIQNMRTMAAALSALVNIRQELRNIRNVEREDVEVGNFYHILADIPIEEETDEERQKSIEDLKLRRKDFFKAPMQQLFTHVSLKEGMRKQEVQKNHTEGVIRYMTLLANDAKITQINNELREFIKNDNDLRRIEQNIRNSGALIYQFNAKFLAEIIKIIEDANANPEKVNEKLAEKRYEGLSLLVDPLVKFWLPKKL